MTLSTFSCACLLAICISSLEKRSFRSFVVLLLIIDSLISLSLICKSSLWHLHTSPLSDIWCANIFSHSVAYLFTFFMMSSEAWKGLVSMVSNLSIFPFVACVFGVVQKKSLPRPMSGSFSPVFSSRNFTVLGLMFVFNLFWVNFCLTLRFESHSLLAYLLINLWMPPFPPPLTHIPFVLPDLTKGHLFRETFDQDFRNLGIVWEPPG